MKKKPRLKLLKARVRTLGTTLEEKQKPGHNPEETQSVISGLAKQKMIQPTLFLVG